MTLDTRADLAVRGVRVPTPVRRPAGAGPSDDGHLVIDGRNAALPINPASPYTIDRGKIWLGEIDTGLSLDVVRRPRFYDRTTADGVRYEQIARLHGKDVLATTVVQTCVRYAEDQRCRFCTIEESLRSGSTIAAKTPAQLAEVARAAVDLDGVRQMVMTTGTTTGPDRGARNLVRCVRAVLEAVPGLPIQVQIEPPGDLSVIDELHAAGAASIGIHVESLDDAVRREWMPGKGSVPMAEYEAAWDHAVAVFGRNQVSTYLLIGLGEDPAALVEGARKLIERGVYPFVVPYRPVVGAMIKSPAPAPSVVLDISDKVAAMLRAAGMLGSDQKAGCAACGACGVLQAAGG
ncbi:MSMEG_0568 family radical SAM protein [Actinoplanes sp. NPDC049265]|uniref:MSMEG_0568 family radical SAM protein n=1 Tax=Actinoplanes sp. NPDC049265 TaxID=3363902 RepID=UPI003712871A